MVKEIILLILMAIMARFYRVFHERRKFNLPATHDRRRPPGIVKQTRLAYEKHIAAILEQLRAADKLLKK